MNYTDFCTWMEGRDFELDHCGDFELRERDMGYDNGGDPDTMTEAFVAWAKPIIEAVEEKARECGVVVRISTSSEYGSIFVDMVQS